MVLQIASDIEYGTLVQWFLLMHITYTNKKFSCHALVKSDFGWGKILMKLEPNTIGTLLSILVLLILLSLLILTWTTPLFAEAV